MTALVLLNSLAGTLAGQPLEEQAKRIEAVFAGHGVRVEVRPVEPERLTETARRAAERFDVIVAGGGDGTLRSVAQGVLGKPASFAVLPLGTFNHLARELGMPLELESAVEAIARGRVTEMPVAQANGQLFLSFAAFGLYTEAIRHREAQRRTRGRGKPLAMALALLHVLGRMPLRRVRLELEHEQVRRFTPVLVVATNAYQLKGLGLSEDVALDRSCLNICLARPTTRWGTLMLVLATLLGRSRRWFETLREPAATLATRRAREHVVLDGELTVMEMPMRCGLCEQRLRVIVPPDDLRQEFTTASVARR